MKIHCDTCGAKYSIADDKVEGKVFKIRCKECSDVIVVKGEQDERTRDMNEEHDVYGDDYDDSSDDSEWYAVIDGEQVGPVTAREIEGYIDEGVLEADSYVWREGLGDWEPLDELDPFAGTFGGSGGAETAAPDEQTMVADNPRTDDEGDFDIESAAPAQQDQDPNDEAQTVVTEPGEFGPGIGGGGGQEGELLAAEGGRGDDALRDDLAEEATDAPADAESEQDSPHVFDDGTGGAPPDSAGQPGGMAPQQDRTHQPQEGEGSQQGAPRQSGVESGSHSTVESGSHSTAGASSPGGADPVAASGAPQEEAPTSEFDYGDAQDVVSGTDLDEDDPADDPASRDSGGASFESFSGESGTADAAGASSGASATSSPSDGGGGQVSANDMVEERNENSVLFSLDSADDMSSQQGGGGSTAGGSGGGLDSEGSGNPSAGAAGEGGEGKPEGSGLIDIQSLASTHAAMKSDGDEGGRESGAPSPASGGGGGESASQDVSPAQPTSNNVPNLSPSGSRRNSRWLIAAVVFGALALLAVVGIGGYVLVYQDGPQTKTKTIVQNQKTSGEGESGDESSATGSASDDEKGSEDKPDEEDKRAASDQKDDSDPNDSNNEDSRGDDTKKADNEESDSNNDSEPKQAESSDDEEGSRERMARNDRGGSESDDSQRAGAADRTGGGREQAQPTTTNRETNNNSNDSQNDEGLDSLLNNVGDDKGGGSEASANQQESSEPSGGGGGGPNLPEKPTRSMVKNTIAKYQGRIDRCASESNRDNLSGSVFIKFRIQPSGEVSTAAVRTAKFKGTDVGNCTQRVVKSMSFPRTQNGMPVKFPFSIE